MTDERVYRTDMGPEVVPLGDADGHVLGEHCACEPRVEPLGVDDEGDEVRMVVHNAWDGRE